MKRRKTLLLMALLLTAGVTPAQILIEGNVYGGGKVGEVTQNTSVKMNNGEVGTIEYINVGNATGVDYDAIQHTTGGKVYGGGMGDQNNPNAGTISGNTNVEINGGHVYFNTYGGGELGSVTGKASVTVTGGQVGPEPKVGTIDGKVYAIPIALSGLDGYVFGGGEGMSDVSHETYANVGSSEVTVEIPDDAPITSNRIWGSIFGGGEDGHVLGDVLINFNSGHIGTWGTTSYDGNIFGGGRDYEHKDQFAGVVEGNITVNMTGGTMFGCIYGGGRLGSVGINQTGDTIPDVPNQNKYYGYVTVNVSGGTVGRPEEVITYENPSCTIPYNRATIGHIYGGCMGIYGVEDWDKYGKAKQTKVNISDDALVYGNVHGGAQEGFVLKNSIVNISGGTIGSMDATGKLHKTGGEVFGGGKGHNQGVEAGRVKGNTYVTVSGGKIYYNVYGGGNMASVGPSASGSLSDTLGVAKVRILGGQIGPDFGVSTDVTNPDKALDCYVFGGGKGLSSGTNYTSFGWVDSTYLEVDMPMATAADTTSNKIWGSIFGGAEDGYVRGGVCIYYKDGLMGTSGKSSYDGNIFGGGRNYNAVSTMMTGSVGRNITIYMQGGRLKGNIYGGGRLGSVGVMENGAMYTDANHGKITVNMSGGEVGFEDLVTTTSGSVFGGCMGRNDKLDLSKANNTFVNISSNARVYANVYGGGEVGQINQNTNVNVTGGLVGTIEAKKAEGSNIYTYYEHTNGGSVFGGGKGDDSNPELARVKGNSTVTIGGGHVYNNVYGGGELASVGLREAITDNDNNILDYKPVANTGLATVTIKGGQVGPAPKVESNYNITCGLNGTDGYVFGGGKGVSDDYINDPQNHPYSGQYYDFADVNNTIVTIEIPADADTTTNRIWGSSFGGAEDGHVLGDAYTYYKSGFMGTRGKTSYDGNIFGGGRNFSKANYNAGRVRGNNHVEMSGGQIFGSIFGGGRLALTGVDLYGDVMEDEGNTKYGSTFVTVKGGKVGNDTKVTVDGTEMDVVDLFTEHSMGDVFGGGKGDKDGIVGHPKASALLVSIVKNTTVVITEEDASNPTVIYGSVFGGGEVASVGQFDWDLDVVDPNYDPENPNANHPTPTTIGNIRMIEGTGKTKVTVSGGTIGATKAQMRYELVDNGTGIHQFDMKYHCDRGHVLGGGEGRADDPDTYPTINPGTLGGHNNKSLLDLLATVGETDVTITNNEVGEGDEQVTFRPLVKGSVYGGGMNGHVMRDTKVTVAGGQIGVGYDKESDEEQTIYAENKFFNPLEYFEENPTYTDVADADALFECFSWDYDPATNRPYDPIDLKANPTHIPSDGKSWFGNVFGGGSGYYPYIKQIGSGSNATYEAHWDSIAGKVYGKSEVFITGGHVLTSVYGGCETTDVVGSASVTMSGGTLGVPRTKNQINLHPVTCYLFGAGKGDPRTDFNTWTNVASATVTVADSAIVYGSIFGGGEEGHVLADAHVIVKKSLLESPTVDTLPIIGTTGTSSVDGNIFGGGRGFSGEALTAGTVGGNVNVEIEDGIMFGSIYGGGRLASVGTHFTAPNDPNYGQYQAGENHGHVTIDITGGTIGNDFEAASVVHTKGGNVYGGSMGRLTLLNGDNNTIWPSLAKVKHTTITVGQGENKTTLIKGNVYGGGELGTIGLCDNAQNSSTVISIEGGTIKRNVFGGGYGSDITTAQENDSSYLNTTTNVLQYATPMQIAGRVYGNTSVSMSAGTVEGSIYGGGEMASVGYIRATDSIKHLDPTNWNNPSTGNPYFLSWPYQFTYVSGTGTATVEITGGTVGTTGSGNGDVFGGGMGIAGPRHRMAQCANVDNTIVNISQTSRSTTSIMGNVYGGGENGHVNTNAQVTMNSGTIEQNIYGAGKGTDTYLDEVWISTSSGGHTVENQQVHSITAGKVYGNTTVTMNNGTVKGNVYGGGEFASVGKSNYMGYGETGNETTAQGSGQTHVYIYGGTVGTDGDGNGMVFGSSKGTTFPTINLSPRYYYSRDFFLGYANNTEVKIGNGTSMPTVNGSVFGGGEDGHVRLSTVVNVKSGTVGAALASGADPDSDAWKLRGNVYGAGRGIDFIPGSNPPEYCPSAGSVTRNTTVTIEGGTIYNNVYGGGSMAAVGPPPGFTNDPSLCKVDIKGGTIGASDALTSRYGGYVFGAGRGIACNDATWNAWNNTTPAPSNPSPYMRLATCVATQVNISEQSSTVPTTIQNVVFGGGSNGRVIGATGVSGDTEVNMNGGTVVQGIYGGGQGVWGESGYENDYISGRVEGNTFVKLMGGEVGRVENGIPVGQVFGGSRRADVMGNAIVHVGNEVSPKGDVTIHGSVFGANNHYGSPKGNVEVHVYHTHHTGQPSEGGDAYPNPAPDDPGDLEDIPNAKSNYAIYQVFGGGNESDYVPVHSEGSTKRALVKVYECDENTIYEVYGGGKAANIGSSDVHTDANVIIEGGRMNQVFGGGYGTQANPANVYGTANTTIEGGIINQLFGGSNSYGNILQTNLVVMEEGECLLLIGDGFGSGNNAPIVGNVVTTLLCGQGSYNNFYGGASIGDIVGNVTLNVFGGTFNNIFGGSKGRPGTTADDSADIMDNPETIGVQEGNVTLNLFGGSINKGAFGGSDVNGKIDGKITVNVYNIGLDNCGLNLENLYGAGRYTAYEPTFTPATGTERFSPEVNIIHGTVKGNVYGGGQGDVDEETGLLTATAITKASPVVNMGYYSDMTTSGLISYLEDIIDGTDYDWTAPANNNYSAYVGTNQNPKKGNIFGGGQLAQVEGNTYVYIRGQVLSGSTTWNNIAEGSVYGGGQGTETDPDAGLVKKNTTIDLSGGHVQRSVYGGGALGSVGTFTEYYTEPSGAHVAGEPKVCDDDTGLTTVLISGGVVGRPDAALMPTPDSDDDFGYVFAGGRGEADSITYPKANLLAVVDNSYLEISGGIITASAYGGCENGLTLKDTHVKVMGGQIGLGYYKSGNVNNFESYLSDEWEGRWTTAINAIRDFTFDDDLADELGFHECDHWPFDFEAPCAVYDWLADQQHQQLGYNAQGGTVSPTDGHSFFGNVFGGGSGYYPFWDANKKSAIWRRSAGRVWGDTWVEITGGHILTNVYAGNETTDVFGKAKVTMSDGTVGVPRTAEQIEDHPVSCNIYGAGMGDPRMKFNTWANVKETEITLTGGTVFGSVYGGGEFGHVLENTQVTLSPNTNNGHNPLIGTTGTAYYDGHIFGGGKGCLSKYIVDLENGNTVGRVGGNTNVDVSAGNILGCIYGGGELALTGVGETGRYTSFMLPQTNPPAYDSVNHGLATIKVSGTVTSTTDNAIYSTVLGNNAQGAILENDCSLGDIFGGGRGDLDYYEDILAGCVGKTDVTVEGSPRIYCSVFGGGEFGSVGYWYYNIDTHPFVKGTGSTNVTIQGSPIIGLEEEFSAANISHPSYWTFIETINGVGRLFHTCSGNVFGAGQGDAAVRYYPSWVSLARSRRASVLIKDNPTIMSSVYGGAEQGTVTGDTHVEIQGGTIGLMELTATDGSKFNFGNVYGGGFGVDSIQIINQSNDSINYPTNNANPSLVANVIAGRVYGNTFVTISGGAVRGNVFGGGNMASVGRWTEVKNGNTLIDYAPVANTGKATVSISGKAIIGPMDGTGLNGYVYGGGKGIGDDPDPTNNRNKYCNINSTKVTIDLTYTTPNETNPEAGWNAATDGRIYGSVYGGGSDCHVLGNTKVIFNGGIIGTYKDATEGITAYGGNIFGGGRNFTKKNYAAGRVAGNPEIEMNGGYVYGAIFGGGRHAVTGTGLDGMHMRLDDEATGEHGKTTVKVKGGTVGYKPLVTTFTSRPIGDVYGAGKGTMQPISGHPAASPLLIALVKNTVVEISQPTNKLTHVLGSVYGGGEVGNVGRYTWKDENGNITEIAMASDGHSQVTVKGGRIGVDRMKMSYQLVGGSDNDKYNPATNSVGNVFGGGRGLSDDPATYGSANINTVEYGDKYLLDLMASAGSTTVTVTNEAIGEGEGQIIKKPWVKGSVYGGSASGHILGDTEVFIDGGQIGSGDNANADEWYEDNDFLTTGTTHECYHWEYDADAPQPFDLVAIYNGITGDGVYPDDYEYKPTDGRTWYGNVFGGGSGFLPYVKNGVCVWNPDCGKVYGNSTVTITGGHILSSVYGGSEVSDVGDFGIADANYTANNPAVHVGELYCKSGGTATVIMSDGTVGVPRTTQQIKDYPVPGYLFGAGKGDSRNNFNALTNVNSTTVTISDGAKVFGSVLGGAEQGHVIGDANVVVEKSSTSTVVPVIGSTGFSGYDGHVFGGGWGDKTKFVSTTALTYNCPAGRVGGNTAVTMSEGKVLGNVYGGGYVARTGVGVGGNYESFISVFNAGEENEYSAYDSINHGVTTVEVRGGLVGNFVNEGLDLLLSDQRVGNVYGGGRGSADEYHEDDLGRVAKANVTITSNGANKPMIYGSVFGGGQMANVGHWNNYESWYTKGTGATKVTITGSPTIGTPKEFIPHYATGDDVKTQYDVINNVRMLSHTRTGNVFGGGQGDMKKITGAGGVVEAVGFEQGHCRTTTVDVSGTPTILSCVFGGSEQGAVWGDANVIIAGGNIGQEGLLSDSLKFENGQWTVLDNHATYSFGSVFGGSYGLDSYSQLGIDDPAVADTVNFSAGRVYRNTSVTITGGAVRGNVFGGGHMASVGQWTKVKENGNIVDLIPALDGITNQPTGKATVSVSGSAIIGPLDMTGLNAYVFGGGKGIGNDLGDLHKRYGNVNSTKVTVNLGEEGHVYGSLFGGGSDGHVLGDAEVNFNGGTLGTAGTTTWDGNIFGGGRNFRATNITAGRVGGNITVKMTNGTMYGNIYGGGRLASIGVDLNGEMYTSNTSTHGNTFVTVTGGTIGNEHKAEGPSSTGTTIYPLVGQIGGNIFGGAMGEDTDPDKTWTDPIPANQNASNFAAYTEYIKSRIGWVRSTDVKVSGTSSIPVLVRGNVFGGAKSGRVKDNTKVTIEGNSTIGESRVAEGHPDLDELFYSGSVYGAGLGSENSVAYVNGLQANATADPNMLWSEVGRVCGNTEVYINNTSSGTPKIYNNIYGGGALGNVGTVNNGSYASGTGTTYVEVNGGKLGPLDGTGTNAYVFAGGRGQPPYFLKDFGRVYETHLVVQNQAIVYGSLFGGGEDGQVDGDAWTEMKGGTIGTDGISSWDGNIFGGGRNFEAQCLNAGRVGGNITVEMTNGELKGSIFGGGRQGLTGILDDEDATPIDDDDHGNITVTVSGGTVGTDEAHKYIGHVFGGGKGNTTIDAANVYFYKRLAEVRSTLVTITGDATVNGSVYGGSEDGHVLKNATAIIAETATVGAAANTLQGNVFGGGRGVNPDENNHVYNPDAGRVLGQSRANITGGTVKRHVFGGGDRGIVVEERIVNVSEADATKPTTIEGSVFGGSNTIPNKNADGEVYEGHGKLKTVNVRGGHIEGSVYGCSYDAKEKTAPDEWPNTDKNNYWTSFVNVTGGTIDNNVYAAGYGGKVDGSVCVNVGLTAVQSAPTYANNSSGTVQVNTLRYDGLPNNSIGTRDKLIIGGNIFGGSYQYENSNNEIWQYRPDITGYSTLFIDGEGYDTELNETANAAAIEEDETHPHYMNIGGGIYGSGNFCESGAKGRNVLLRNYGTRNPTANAPAAEFTEASRTMTTIQRGSFVVLDNTNIHLVGASSINQEFEERNFGVLEIDSSLYVTNGTGIVLGEVAHSAYMDSIHQVTSLCLVSGANVYNQIMGTGNANNWEMVGIMESDNQLYRIHGVNSYTALTTPLENTIIFKGDSKLWVRYSNSAENKRYYGQLLGFFRMRAEAYSIESRTSFAYARPKLTAYVNPLAGYPTGTPGSLIDTWNKGDGGFLSYDYSLNTFTTRNQEVLGFTYPENGYDGGDLYTNTKQYPYFNLSKVTRNDHDDVDVEDYRLWALPPALGHKWYVDGRGIGNGNGGWGKDASHEYGWGEFPDKPKLTVSGANGIYNDPKPSETQPVFNPAIDIVFVVGPIDAIRENTELNQTMIDNNNTNNYPLHLYRYPGGHKMSKGGIDDGTGQAPTDEATWNGVASGTAGPGTNYGAMIIANRTGTDANTFVMDSVVVDGLFEYEDTEISALEIPNSYGTTWKYGVSEPLVVTTPSSKLTLKGGTTLKRGYNNKDASVTWYINADYSSYSQVGNETVITHHGGALFVDKDATVNVSDSVLITGNKQHHVVMVNNTPTDRPVECNVYLPTFTTSLNIIGRLNDSTRIGVTSPMRNRAASYEDNTFSPVAAATTSAIANAAWQNCNFTDDQKWFFVNHHNPDPTLNNRRTTYYYDGATKALSDKVLYFGWTWANVVRKRPAAHDLSDDVLDDFGNKNINSPHDLAWILTRTTGLDGAEATDFKDVDLAQTADIDLKQYIWVPIGEDGTDIQPFAGNYDGNGHLITNVNVKYIGTGDRRYERTNYGLFGYVKGSIVDRTFVVSGLIDPTHTAADAFHLGGLVGCMENDGADISVVSNSEAAIEIDCPVKSGNTIVAGGLVAKLVSGEIHSSMAMPTMTVTDPIGTTSSMIGGLVGLSKSGQINNSFVNVTFSIPDHEGGKIGGLLGENENALMKNCYVNLHYSGATPTSFVNDSIVAVNPIPNNKDNIDNCYVFGNYVIKSHCGDSCGQFASPIDADMLGYMYADNRVSYKEQTSTGSTVKQDTTMFLVLNRWVDKHNKTGHKYARWARPGLQEINGDLPVLLLSEFDGEKAHQGGFRSLGTYAGGNVLQYGGPARDSVGDVLHEVDSALVREQVAITKDNLFIYGDVVNTITINTDDGKPTQGKVSIYEHASIKSAGDLADFENTYVGITFDNSKRSAQSTAGINDGIVGMGGFLLPRDWHMFSTPLSNAPLGFDYNIEVQEEGGEETEPSVVVVNTNTSAYPGDNYYNNPWNPSGSEFSWVNRKGSDECADGAGNRYWMKAFTNNQETDGYFPTRRGSLFNGNLSDLFIVGNGSDECFVDGNGNLKNRYPYGMDFYTWTEPDYHWINFKRNGPNHWHSDGEHEHIDYEPVSGTSTNINEETLIKGRGYMASISVPTFLQSHGLLNASNSSIKITREGANCQGWNLVGNPYHGYLDFNEFAASTDGNGGILSNNQSQVGGTGEVPFYVIYNADSCAVGQHKNGFLYYPVGGSKNGAYAGRYIHPHQGFFVLAKEESVTPGHPQDLIFKEGMIAMRSEVKDDGFFRDWQPAYPLVNLFLSSDHGCQDITVVEFERPEWGGATKLRELRQGNGLFYGYHDEHSYAAIFAKEGATRVPLWFEAKEDDIFTMKWNTANGDFNSLYLIDNILGVQYDMLANDTYMFEGHKQDYKARFYIVFDVTGVEEEFEQNIFAFFDGSQWLVTGEGELDLVDMQGRVLWHEKLSGGQSRLAFPTLAKSMYLLRLTNSRETKVQKIIVQ